MASVTVVLRKDKLNKNTGKAPLYIRIIKNRKSKFLSLGVKIEPKYWNEDKLTIRKGATNYKELNSYILKKRSEAERTSLELESINNSVSTKIIKEKIVGKKQVEFTSYALNKLENLKPTIAYSTYILYRKNINKFRTYVNGKILFSEIDSTYLSKYMEYMYSIGNSRSTVRSCIMTLRVFLKYAKHEKIIDNYLDIFDDLDLKKINVVKNYLTEKQLKDFMDYNYNKKNNSKILIDMFIFSCYAGGLRFSDVLFLKWKNYIEEEKRLILIIKKTRKKHQFILPDKAIEIIGKYKTLNSKEEDYIFPIMHKYNNVVLDEKTISRIIQNNSSLSSLILGNIGTKIKLPFKLSFHTSRHTFATRALNKGMRIEHVSKIMGHSDISITQIYAKIVDKELDKAMEIMNDI